MHSLLGIFLAFNLKSQNENKVAKFYYRMQLQGRFSHKGKGCTNQKKIGISTFTTLLVPKRPISEMQGIIS